MSEPDVRAAAILLAAGVGKRIGATRPKAFLPIGERQMLSVAAAAAAASPRIGALVVAAPPGYEDEARSSVEGLDLPQLRARSLQFHPEAGPGPHDAWPLLEAWVEELRLAEAA